MTRSSGRPTIPSCATLGQWWSARRRAAPYKGDNFSHLFREIADAAGFKTKQFIDLRRSSVVRLSLAGCTPQLISAITGHSIESVVRILHAYNPTTKEQSDLAIAVLQAWRERRHSPDSDVACMAAYSLGMTRAHATAWIACRDIVVFARVSSIR